MIRPATYGLAVVCLLLAACVNRNDVPFAAYYVTLTANSASIPADGVSAAPVNIVLRDYAGDAAQGVALILTADASTAAVHQPAITGADGTTQASITSTRPGTVQVNAAAVRFGQRVALAGDALVNFTAAFGDIPVNTALSGLTALPQTLLADGVATSLLTGTVVDNTGTPIPQRSVTLQVTGSDNTLVSAAGESAVGDTLSGITDAQGVFIASLSSRFAEGKVATFSAGGFSAQTSIAFLAGNVSAANSTLQVSPTSAVANNTNDMVLTLTLLDNQSNPVANQGVSFVSGGTGITITPSSGVTSPTGLLSATLRTQVAQSGVPIHAQIGVNVVASTTATFVPGPPVAASSSFIASPNTVTADGTSIAPLSVVLADAYGNRVGNQNVTFSSSDGQAVFTPAVGTTSPTGTLSANAHSTHATMNTLTANAAGVSLTTLVNFIAGAPVALKSSFTTSPNTVIANNVASSTLTVTVEDAFNNPCPNQNVLFYSNSFGNTFSPALSGTTNPSGQYAATLTSTFAGTKTLRASVAQAFTFTGAVTFTARPTAVCNGLPGFPSPPSVDLNLTPNLTGNGAVSIVLADVNGDQNQDIVALTPSEVAVSINRKNGSFTAAKFFTTGISGGVGLGVGDFDNDGARDFIVISGNTNNFVEYKGAGDGNFTFFGQGSTCNAPAGLTIADFNNDGNKDFAIACASASQIIVFLGYGNGYFLQHTVVSLSAIPSGIVSGNLTADSNVDVVVASQNSNIVVVLLGDGGGGLTPQSGLIAAVAPATPSVGDVNGDTISDLVIANSGASNLTVFAGLNDGTFSKVGTYATGANPNATTLVDLNGDSLLDIASVEYGAAGGHYMALDVFFNRGGGLGFAPAVIYVLGTPATAIANGTLNQDTAPDIIVATTHLVSPLLNTGNGNLLVPPFAATLTPLSGSDSGDINKDGKEDFVASSLFDNSVTAVLGNGDGTFTTVPGLAASTAQEVFLGDIDNNGTLDMLFNGPPNVGVYLGSGDGNFVASASIPIAGATGPGQIAVVDLNRDGINDLLVSISSGIEVFLGRGALAFTQKPTVVVGSAPPFGVADFNNDTYLDLVASNGSGITMYLGAGDGTFTSNISYAFPGILQRGAVGDFNGDGKPDVAVAANQGVLRMYLGNGDGTLTLGASHSFSCGIFAVPKVADMNGDGFADIVFDGFGPEASTTLFLGDGAGGLSAPQIYAAGAGVQSVVVQDWNQDGNQDFVACAYDGAGYTTYLYSACF